MWIITENIWKLLNACETFITVHHITSAEYITIHWGVVPTRTLTWPEDVWQCLTVSECVRPRLTMSDMTCSAKHIDPLQAAPLMKQNFLLPHCQWHLHQQHWGRHLPRDSAFTMPRWKCDMWPKTCSTGVLMYSDELCSHCNIDEQECGKKHILSSSDPHPEPLVWHSFWHTTWKILEVYMASLFWHSIWQ